VSETNGNFILEPQAIQILERYSIRYPNHGVAHDAAEAARIAGRLGYPVVLKIVSPDVVHKSDVGGVVVGLTDAAQVREGFERMHEHVHAQMPDARIEGVLVCQQAPAGLEVIVGALDDATFGPTVMFGLGGIFIEVLKDVSFRIAPLEHRDAAAMIRETRGYALLAGARGQVKRDVAALSELLLAVSKLITAMPDIKELDLNPVRLYEDGLLVLDARMIKREIA